MILLYIFLSLLGLAALLLIICLVRAALMKPTPAKITRITKQADERDLAYGERLGRMVACETISRRDDPFLEKFLRHHQVLEELFPLLHARCERHTLGGSLLFRWPGKGEGQPILLMSHQDVVEATGEWQHPPFCGEVIDGQVWGRGTVDTKGNLFCIMQAAEELMESGFVPPCDVYIAASDDEEISGGGAPETVEFLKSRNVRLRMVLDEGGAIMEKPIGGLNGTYGLVGVLEKGYSDVRLAAKSSGGHASTPGKNTPLVRLGKLMSHIEKKNPYTARLNPTVREMLRRFAPNMDFPLKVVLGNLWLFGPILPTLLAAISPMSAAMVRTTIAFTTAGGSDGLNVLPQEAFVTANIRSIPHQDMDVSLALLTSIAEKYDVETQVLEARAACPVVSHQSGSFKLVEDVMARVYPGVGVSPYVMTGGTDARHYTDICDDVLRFAPLYINADQLNSVHGLDEHIDCAALGLGVDFFKTLIESV